MRQNLRLGFTLIELLVVIAILGVLAGLVLAAVQQVRAGAYRVQCSNNLRQLGLALAQYQNVQRTLPPGCSYQNGKAPYLHMSWCTRLLPFLEQEALWERTQQAFAADSFFFDNPPHVGLTMVIPVFGCPADSRTLRSRAPDPAFTSFLGVEGTDQSTKDGTLFLDSRVRLVDITDGTSNTLLVGERPPSGDGIFGWWYGGWGQSRDGSADMILGARERNAFSPGHPELQDCPAGPYHFQSDRIDNKCALFHFWSLHPGGANFLMADGSVHFLGYDADALLPSLATRAGGEVAALP
jgi:prepilin-type N-terminal cleavage/methylation domain-containing protein/prepilin-type processing-associated H-X9-DG protein